MYTNLYTYITYHAHEKNKKNFFLSYIIGSRGVYIDVKEIDFVFYVKRNLCVRVQQTNILMYVHNTLMVEVYDKKVLAKRNGI